MTDIHDGESAVLDQPQYLTYIRNPVLLAERSLKLDMAIGSNLSMMISSMLANV